VPLAATALPEPADLPTGAGDHGARDGEVVVPGLRYVELVRGQDVRHVGEVVGLAVDGDLQQRPGAERVARTSGPAVDLEQARQEVGEVELPLHVREVLVERLHQPRADVLPQQHGPGHEDVGGIVALEAGPDAVREVLVASQDAHVETVPRLRFELPRVPLHRRDVGVRVGREVADDPHRSPRAYERTRDRSMGGRALAESRRGAAGLRGDSVPVCPIVASPAVT
jgi:hypothetical protein